MKRKALMKSKFRILSVFCLATVLVVALAGCSAPNQAAKEQQSANRQYMAQVNQAMDDLNSRLQTFNEAVSRGDAVTMKTQADNAFKVIDQLEALTPPDAFKDIQGQYVDGCKALKDALNSYITLFSEVSSATEAAPFDYSTYDTRINQIKQKYDEGIKKLEAADKAATDLPS
ncbi:MAG: hypothetical protein RRX94_04200 [Raoultibacter sp.]